jgi:hypothetical protein
VDDIGPGSHEHVSLCQNGHNVFLASDGSSRYGMSTIGEDFYGRVSASSSFNFGLHGTNSIQVAILSYHFPVLANIYFFFTFALRKKHYYEKLFAGICAL